MITFTSEIDPTHRYAVAVPCKGGMLVEFQSYPTLEALNAGYVQFEHFAGKLGITHPVRIEYVDATRQRCRILQTD